MMSEKGEGCVNDKNGYGYNVFVACNDFGFSQPFKKFKELKNY